MDPTVADRCRQGEVSAFSFFLGEKVGWFAVFSTNAVFDARSF
jgi:hypothetical protein